MKNKIVFFVFLLAFLIRLISLNQSLWLDEATTARVIKQYNYQEIITKFSPTDFHPPLYYLFMKFWTNIFGYSEISLRMPSVLFSLAVGWVVYLLAGVWGAVFFLFNPLIVYYSHEARMYMMATMFLTLSLYYFLKKKKILFGIFGGLGMLTFYGSVFLVATFLLYFLYKRQYKYFILNTLYFILVFLLVSPLLYQQLLNAKVNLSNVTNWSYVLGKVNLKNLILIPIKFSIGRISFEPKWLYYLITGGWTVFVFSKLKKISLFLSFFIFPLVLGFFISFFTPLLQYFRFIYLIPIMAILLSFGLSNKAKIQPPGLILAGGFLIFSFLYLLLPQFHREDWKNLAKSLPAGRPVYMILSSSDPLKYYNKNLEIKELKSLSSLSREIIIIPYTSEIHGVNYKKILLDGNYKLTSKKTFRGLIIEEYSRK